ncbi:MAG TPA: CDP-alcohol phosphatidyltransferase family protein, partial [Anaerolineae bacterium]|nr:CDP-alcohol phosphatidyltransferase family protein [Anaerolineae bacterium]
MKRLRREWVGVVLGWAAVVALLYTGLARVWPDYAGRWLGLTAVFSLYSWWMTWRALPENHREGETAGDRLVLPTLGWGNRLTLLRGLLISLTAGFLFSPWPAGWLGWLPAVFYVLSDVADYLDGYVARVTNHATRLGGRLDMTFDGLGVLVVTALAIWYGQLPLWYLPIGLGRYLFLAGLAWRQRRGLPIYEMPFSWHRRIFAGFQMAFLSAVLWPIVPAAGATIAGMVFGLATTASFGRDWLVTIGWIDPKSARYRLWRGRLYRWTAVYLPPYLRVGVLVCMAFIYGGMANPVRPLAWVLLFTGWGLPWPEWWATFWAVAGLAATGMVSLGVMGRVAALVLVFPIGFDMVTRGLQWENGLALALVCALMLLGTGMVSLWQPEERYVFWQAGDEQ